MSTVLSRFGSSSAFSRASAHRRQVPQRTRFMCTATRVIRFLYETDFNGGPRCMQNIGFDQGSYLAEQRGRCIHKVFVDEDLTHVPLDTSLILNVVNQTIIGAGSVLSVLFSLVLLINTLLQAVMSYYRSGSAPCASCISKNVNIFIEMSLMRHECI